jgi:hypothetical protein
MFYPQADSWISLVSSRIIEAVRSGSGVFLQCLFLVNGYNSSSIWNSGNHEVALAFVRISVHPGVTDGDGSQLSLLGGEGWRLSLCWRHFCLS